MPEIRTFSRELGGKTLTVESGRIANLANGSLTVRYGDTMVLCTATMSISDSSSCWNVGLTTYSPSM